MQPPQCNNALTLIERIAVLRSGMHGELPGPNADCRAASERANRWRLQYPFTDPDVFAQRLATADITEEEFLSVTGDDEAGLLGAGPTPWLRTIDVAYTRQGPSAIRFDKLASTSATAQVHFLRCAEPIVDHFVSCLRAGALEMTREFDTVPFEPDSVHQLFVPTLINTFQRMLTPTLVLELNLARLQNDLTGESSSERFDCFVRRLGDRAFALQILSDYPVLARELVGRADQWFASSLEFLRHLSRDWPMIQASFAPHGDVGILHALQTQLGDRHRGGRSVQIASFDSGFSIVYKPRSLQVERHFQELLEWLNRRIGDLAFRSLTILDRGTHGWSEFVSGADCVSEDGVRRFYERQGGYLALFYVLNGSDIHCENVIASGEHPLVVDLEALFHAPVAEPGPGTNDIAFEGLARSVLRCGLLPVPARFGEQAQPLDRSGLAAPPSQLSPFALLHPVESGTDEMQLVRQRSPIRASAHWPEVAGRPVERLDVDAVERGFRQVYEVLLSNRDDLLDVGGPVTRFRGDEVRIVLRHTRSYARLWAESFHPDMLRNALDRDQLFDMLWGDVPDQPHLRRVIMSECRDLWNGDVPLFTGRVGSRDLFTSTGERIPDFLPEPSDAPVRRRIEALSRADLERQSWLVRASLMTLEPGRTRVGQRRPNASCDDHVGNERARLVAQARRIGDRLDALAVRSGTRAGWIGLAHDNADEWSVKPVGHDLYGGTAGIVLFLAYLAETTKEERYFSLALAAVAHLREQASAAWDRGDENIGPFNGWGGLIYVYCHLSVLWKNVQLIDDARSIVDDIIPLIDHDAFDDVLGGSAGCITSLLAMYDVAPSDAVVSAAVRCGEGLVRRARATGPGLAWPSAFYGIPLGGFSHGVAGIAHSLFGLAKLSGHAKFSQTALAALRYERSLYDPTAGNWTDLRPLEAAGSKGSNTVAWCHGAPGIGLSRLSMLTEGEYATVHQEIAQAVATTLASGFGDNHSLCHGDLGNLDFLVEASEVLENGSWRSEVRRLTGRVLHDIERNGWRCGGGKPIETPGLMTGLAGIGYGMLRLAEPGLVPSVLRLSPPVRRNR